MKRIELPHYSYYYEQAKKRHARRRLIRFLEESAILLAVFGIYIFIMSTAIDLVLGGGA